MPSSNPHKRPDPDIFALADSALACLQAGAAFSSEVMDVATELAKSSIESEPVSRTVMIELSRKLVALSMVYTERLPTLPSQADPQPTFYVIEWTPGSVPKIECEVRVGEDCVRMLHHWAHHSPDGFNCGYGGSGPADLALAILSDHLGVPVGFDYSTLSGLEGGLIQSVAWSHHQAFKFKFIAPREAPFTITGEEIDAFLHEHQVARDEVRALRGSAGQS